MKNYKQMLIPLTLLTVLSACSPKNDEKTLKVVTSFFPMKEILLNVKDDIANDGYKLVIEEMNDPYYKQPNEAVKNNKVDANMIQHKYFLSGYNADNNADIKVYLPIYYSFFSIYSANYSNPADVAEGTKVIVPNDKYNLRRALLLLDEAELLDLNDKETKAITTDKISDFITNPKKLEFIPVALSMLASQYKANKNDHIVTMYPTYAKSIGLEGAAERLYVESLNDDTKGYAITLAGLPARKNEGKIISLIKNLNSEKTKNWLEENYKDAAVPALNLD